MSGDIPEHTQNTRVMPLERKTRLVHFEKLSSSLSGYHAKRQLPCRSASILDTTLCCPIDPVPGRCMYYQNRQIRSNKMTRPKPANGPYCFSKSSQLIRTAALLYLRESSRSLDDISPKARSISIATIGIPASLLTHLFQGVSSVQ